MAATAGLTYQKAPVGFLKIECWHLAYTSPTVSVEVPTGLKKIFASSHLVIDAISANVEVSIDEASAIEVYGQGKVIAVPTGGLTVDVSATDTDVQLILFGI